jgi:putative ABC transport system permease protein
MQPFAAVERAIIETPNASRAEGWIATEAAMVEQKSQSPTRDAPAATLHGGSAGGTHGGGAPTGPRFTVLGIPPVTPMLNLELAEGRGLQPGEVDAIVINTALAMRSPDMRVGGTVSLQMGPATSVWRIVGIAREPFSPSTAYVSREYFERAGGHAGMANSVRIALKRPDTESVEAFKEALDRALDAAGIRALSATSKKESRYAFDQHMLMIYVFLLVMSVIIGAVGGLGLMTTMSLNVLERRREMGVLRAIGARLGTIWLIVTVEAVVVGLMSGIIAILLAVPVSRTLSLFIGSALFRSDVAFVFDPRGPIVWLTLSIGLGVIASFLPAWNASRTPVREALAFE